MRLVDPSVLGSEMSSVYFFSHFCVFRIMICCGYVARQAKPQTDRFVITSPFFAIVDEKTNKTARKGARSEKNALSFAIFFFESYYFVP